VPLSHFSENPTLASRAVQIWQILVGKAHGRQTMTYAGLARLLGYEGSGTLGRQLGHIMFYCAQNDLPPLTVLVVNSETGHPGDAFQHESEIHALRESVYKYDWFNLVPPSEQDYIHSWETAENNNWRT